MATMRVFLIALDTDAPRDLVKNHFADENRIEILPHVWLVRSDLMTTEDVAEKLGVRHENDDPAFHYVVVTAEFYTGFGRSAVLQKLRIWGER